MEKSKLSKKPAEPLPVIQKKRRSREEERDDPCFLSNDGYLWTDINPDLKLIEPRILVSTNFNYLEFSRKPNRPPERRSITLINHGDYPIAFRVQTTDNYSYFVDRKCGVLPPRQTCVNAAIRMPNTAVIQVFRRPHEEYREEDKDNFYNRPRKDKMFIQLAPQMCQTFSPEAIFHNERCHEKLRVMLRYSGIEEKPSDVARPKQRLLQGVPGWATWKEDNTARKKKNAREIADFRKIERTIIQNASKEACEELPKMPLRRFSPAPSRSRTPGGLTRRGRPGGMMKMFRNLSPFDRTPTIKKTQSETPKKPANEAPTPVLTPTKKSVEQPKKLLNEPPSPGLNPAKKSTEQLKKGHSEAPSPAMTPAKKSIEHVPSPKKAQSPKQKSKRKSLEQEIPPSPNFLKKTQTPTTTTPTPKKSVRNDAPSPKHEKKSVEPPSPKPLQTPNSKTFGEQNSKSPKPNAGPPI